MKSVVRFARLIHPQKLCLVLCLISLVGFMLRLLVSLELFNGYAPVKNPSEFTDMFTYQQLSKKILDGSYDYSKGFYYQPFYYTVFLPLIYKLFGLGKWPVIIVQAFLGSIVIFQIGYAFSAIFGKRSGIIAAVITALSRSLIFYTPFTLITILQTFLVTQVFYLAVIGFCRKSLWGLACFRPGSWMCNRHSRKCGIAFTNYPLPCLEKIPLVSANYADNCYFLLHRIDASPSTLYRYKL